MAAGVKRSMLERVASVLTRVMHRMMPDPFVIAVLLTLVTFAAAFVQTWTGRLGW